MSQSVILKLRVMDFVRDNPGKSASQIAKALSEGPASVSSLLKKLCDMREMRRLPGKGPRGGYGYYF